METIAERYDTATGARAKFEPERVVLQDQGRWNGVRMEEWEGEGTELPESVLFQHGLVVHETAVQAEVRWSGRRPASAGQRPGSVGILPAGMPYRARGVGPSRTLVMAIAPELLHAAVRTPGARPLELVPAYGMHDDFVLAVMKTLAADVRAGLPFGALYGESMIAALGMYLIRHHAADPRVRPDMPSATDRRRDRVRDHIHDRLHDALTLAELAGVAGLDLYSFARWFKKAFGVPPYQFVLQARIERAKALLGASNEPIVDIALQCGFGSHSHLTTAFRRMVGVSPSGYRKWRS